MRSTYGCYNTLYYRDSIMYIIYFDEVKNRPHKQRYYWLGALAIPHDLALDLETKVNDISNEVFGSPLLSKDTEFHGNEIICGTRVRSCLLLLKNKKAKSKI